MKSVTSLSPAALRELAAAIEATDPTLKACKDLSPEAAAKLADMLIAGKRPTIGWWRRNSTTTPNCDEGEWRPNYYANNPIWQSWISGGASVNTVNHDESPKHG